MAEDRGLIESGSLYNIPRHHILNVKDTDDSVFLIVKHAYKADDEKMHVDAVTTVELPRVAGRIGFGLAKISEERLTAILNGCGQSAPKKRKPAENACTSGRKPINLLLAAAL